MIHRFAHVLQHAILMNTRLVCKGIGPDNSFVGLHREAVTVDTNLDALVICSVLILLVKGKPIVTRAQRHHDLFHRRIFAHAPSR